MKTTAPPPNAIASSHGSPSPIPPASLLRNATMLDRGERGEIGRRLSSRRRGRADGARTRCPMQTTAKRGQLEGFRVKEQHPSACRGSTYGVRRNIVRNALPSMTHSTPKPAPSASTNQDKNSSRKAETSQPQSSTSRHFCVLVLSGDSISHRHEPLQHNMHSHAVHDRLARHHKSLPNALPRTPKTRVASLRYEKRSESQMYFQ